MAAIARIALAAAAVIALGCSENGSSDSAAGDVAAASDSSDGAAGTTDAAGLEDTATGADSAAFDAGGGDTASDWQGHADTSSTGADTSQAGVSTAYGFIVGTCGTLFTALNSTKPAFLTNTYAFDKSAAFDDSKLSKGAKKRFDGANAGGSSKCSEVMSMQLFFDCEKATVHKTETEIKYDKQGSITDYMLDYKGTKLGVSVTRAYKGPMGQTYTLADATKLLTKKLNGIVESTGNVSAADKWSRQVLHVWTLRSDWIALLQAAWKALPVATQADTIVVVTVETGTDLIVANKCE